MRFWIFWSWWPFRAERRAPPRRARSPGHFGAGRASGDQTSATSRPFSEKRRAHFCCHAIFPTLTWTCSCCPSGACTANAVPGVAPSGTATRMVVAAMARKAGLMRMLQEAGFSAKACEPACRGLQRPAEPPAEAGSDLQRPAEASRGLQRPAESCIGLQRPAEACRGLERPAEVWRSLHRLGEACIGLARPGEACRGLRRLAEACGGLPRPAKACRGLSRFLMAAASFCGSR